MNRGRSRSRSRNRSSRRSDVNRGRDSSGNRVSSVVKSSEEKSHSKYEKSRRSRKESSEDPSPERKSHRHSKSKHSSQKLKSSHGRSHRSRTRSSSSSASDTSNSSDESREKKSFLSKDIVSEQFERVERIERERRQLKEEKRKQKEMIKAMETPEQKRLRRLAKKEAKERKRKAMMGWDEEYMSYTNADNPFGDANLRRTFIWDKKFAKVGMKDINEEEIERINRMNMEKNKKELEKVKQRRLEREREREARMEEMSRMQRDKEAAQFKEWEKQEDYFHLKQAKLRSKLRIQEGRAKPIDLLARYIHVFGESDEQDEEESNAEYASEFVEPYMCLNGLRISDLEDLHEDIKVYMELDHKGNLNYWIDLLTIVEDELYKLKRFQASSAMDQREGINAAVSSDVVQVFRGKTPSQLQALQIQIEKKISSGEEGIDIGYWETLLSRLKAHMARARLREKHEANLKIRLEKLKQEQRVNEAPQGPLFPCVSEANTENKKETHDEIKSDIEVVPSCSQKTDEEDDLDLLASCKEWYEAGNYSPLLITLSEMDSGAILIDPEEDTNLLKYQREQVLKSNVPDKKDALKSPEELAFEREARKGMTNDEAVFSVEEVIKQDKNVYSWTDKYRPRKPRYFNRVHTGFEWNKYNQTHYDVDNPPPKVVQGYKFNIFYPDLIDKNKTPTYKITPCADNRDFALIKFTAGPPYEDICFKIVNREWNYSYKSGFRCQFHNNILQLWFHFKRYRYRR